MEKLLVVLLLAVLMLTGCGEQAPPDTVSCPAELYLASHTEEEIFDYFDIAAWPTDYDDPTEIGNRDLEFMAVMAIDSRYPDKADSWHHTEDLYGINNSERWGEYQVPLSAFTDVFDEYFEKYNFDPAAACDYYDEENQILVSIIWGGFGTPMDNRFVSAEVVDDDTIKVTLSVWFEEEVGKCELIANIVDGMPKIQSCETTMN